MIECILAIPTIIIIGSILTVSVNEMFGIDLTEKQIEEITK